MYMYFTSTCIIVLLYKLFYCDHNYNCLFCLLFHLNQSLLFVLFMSTLILFLIIIIIIFHTRMTNLLLLDVPYSNYFYLFCC